MGRSAYEQGRTVFFLRVGSVPDESGYQIASGGVASPNGWKLLFGEAICGGIVVLRC